jgi:hypothetical protein
LSRLQRQAGEFRTQMEAIEVKLNELMKKQ